MSRRVLITGASGFIGANLARERLSAGDEVHLILRGAGTPWRLADIVEHVRVHAADLRDADAVAATLRGAKPDWVYHCAAYGAYSTQNDARRILETNVLGTANLLAAFLASGASAFVNAGSSSEYGWKDHAPGEDEALDPNSDYAVAKCAATLWCRRHAPTDGRRVVTLRLYSVFGPFEEPTRFVPTLALRALEGGWPPLVSPEVARDFVYVDDVAEAFRLAAGTTAQPRGPIYNVATGAMTRVRDAVETARRVFGVASEPVWGSMPDRAWDTNVWVGDPRRIGEALGWRAQTSFEAGLRRTAAWIVEDAARRRRYAEGR